MKNIAATIGVPIKLSDTPGSIRTPPVAGKEFSPGELTFRWYGKGGIKIAIACGKAQVR
jgi:hypothetical protein